MNEKIKRFITVVVYFVVTVVLSFVTSVLTLDKLGIDVHLKYVVLISLLPLIFTALLYFYKNKVFKKIQLYLYLSVVFLIAFYLSLFLLLIIANVEV